MCSGMPLLTLVPVAHNRRAGQTPVQKYWNYLLRAIQEKKIDPTMVRALYAGGTRAFSPLSVPHCLRAHCLRVHDVNHEAGAQHTMSDVYR